MLPVSLCVNDAGPYTCKTNTLARTYIYSFCEANLKKTGLGEQNSDKVKEPLLAFGMRSQRCDVEMNAATLLNHSRGRH